MLLDERIFTEMQHIDSLEFDILFDIDNETFYSLEDGLNRCMDKINSEEEDEETVLDAFSQGMSFELINVEGILYQALLKYYGSQKEILRNVRGATFVDIDVERFLIFAHGLGYNMIDADLLNGQGDGKTMKKFFEIINKD